MNISRTTFVILFVVFGFAFIAVTGAVLNQPPESFLGTESQVAWKSVASTVLSPIKIVLIGPMLPFISFLHRDPDTPPPFFLAMFAVYWSVLALSLHFSLRKFRHKQLSH